MMWGQALLPSWVIEDEFDNTSLVKEGRFGHSTKHSSVKLFEGSSRVDNEGKAGSQLKSTSGAFQFST